MKLLDEPVAPDLEAMHQFRRSFRENTEIVIDLLDAMRSETALIGDDAGVLFLSGMADALRAYVGRTLSAPIQPPPFSGDDEHLFR